MNNYIKNLKPRKNGKYHQGMIDPKKTKKYYSSCKDEPIIYRSGLELQFIQYCENSSKIAKWASEPIEIKYYNRLKEKYARYYPDYIIEDNNGNKAIIEIKPKNQCVKPNYNDSMWLKESWIVNVDKWNAAKKFAEEHNMKFIIINEDFFNY